MWLHAVRCGQKCPIVKHSRALVLARAENGKGNGRDSQIYGDVVVWARVPVGEKRQGGKRSHGSGSGAEGQF